MLRWHNQEHPRFTATAADKEQLKKRLARIEGQVRGISKMIDDDRYCIDILTQLGAVDTALEAVAIKVLEEHVQHCVAGALASGDRKQADDKSRSCSRRCSASPRPASPWRRAP